MFEQRLRELRLRKDMSQADLAKALGVSAGTIGNYESGLRKPKDDFFPKLAEYFGVSEDWLRRGPILTNKQREAIKDRLGEMLMLMGLDEAEVFGIDTGECLSALNSKAPLREDRVMEIANALEVRITDILEDPALMDEGNTIPEEVTAMLQDLYDKDHVLMQSLADATPEELAQIQQFVEFVKSKR